MCVHSIALVLFTSLLWSRVSEACRRDLQANRRIFIFLLLLLHLVLLRFPPLLRLFHLVLDNFSMDTTTDEDDRGIHWVLVDGAGRMATTGAARTLVGVFLSVFGKLCVGCDCGHIFCPELYHGWWIGRFLAQ